MISLEDRKEGTCFLCKKTFHKEKARYAISIYSEQHQQHNFWFHRDCWETIAGKEWLVKEVEE